MAKNIGLLFAGQGAQSVGTGKDLADEFPVAAEMFTSADAILARQLTNVTWKGPIEELDQDPRIVSGAFCSRTRLPCGVARTEDNFPIESGSRLFLAK